MKIDLSTTYAGLKLKSPIIVGSSGLTKDANKCKAYEEAGAGAVVLKSLFEEQIERHANSILYDEDHPEADFLREYLRGNQTGDYMEMIKRTKAVCTIPVIASINCYDTSDNWAIFAKEVEAAGADAVELNLFIQANDLMHDGSSIRDKYLSIVKMVRKAIKIPFMVKISKTVGNVAALVYAMQAQGADGFVLFNRYFQPDINLDNLQLVGGNLFSSPSEIGDTLRWTAIVSGKIKNASIAATTGVHDWKGTAKCILMGASAVEMCTTIYQNGPQIITESLEQLGAWMDKKGYTSLKDFKGKLNSAAVGDPTMYERTQFMKYYSNHD